MFRATTATVGNHLMPAHTTPSVSQGAVWVGPLVQKEELRNSDDHQSPATICQPPVPRRESLTPCPQSRAAPAVLRPRLDPPPVHRHGPALCRSRVSEPGPAPLRSPLPPPRQ